MEIRLNASEHDSLATRVFFSDETGFEVASVIVIGINDAVLLDAQWTLPNAHRVIAEILETGKRLKMIYLTDSDPAHYFGLGTIAEAFPEARVVARRPVANIINFDFRKHWEGLIEFQMTRFKRLIGPVSLSRKTAVIEPLKDSHFDLEGQRVEIIPKSVAKGRCSDMVWIPSIKTLYASDVLYNQAHPLSGGGSQKWIKEIDNIEEMGAEVIIPGHQKPGMRFDKSSLDFTREYLRATNEELSKKSNEVDFYNAMNKRFPQANLLIHNWMNAIHLHAKCMIGEYSGLPD
jgi:glyoxylase-like metal-dependent hydrolase (beta-lactamase superfamily II)